MGRHAPSPAAIAVQEDGRVLVGGLFEEINGIKCSSFARLNSDGSLDEEFRKRFAWDAYSAARRFIAPRIDLAGTPLDNSRAQSGSSTNGINPLQARPEFGVSPLEAEVIWIQQFYFVQGAAIIVFQAAPGRAYVLQARDSLESGAWSIVATNTTGASGVGQLKDEAAALKPMRFYQSGSLP